jgi:hypothetical protein
VIADGTYEVIVVDASDVDASALDADDLDMGPVLRLELAIVAGASKGDTVVVRARHLAMTAVEALGLPGQLVVADQQPHVALER